MTSVATRPPAGGGSAWRRLFRADGLGSLSEADRASLAELGLATVIDLRTSDEATHRGRFPVERVPVRYHEFPLVDVLPTPEDLPSWNETAYVAERYRDMVAVGRSALVGAIEVLAAPGALPAVFHCSAGKDRTGVLSALLLAFLGVPDELIVEDYAPERGGHGRALRADQGRLSRRAWRPSSATPRPCCTWCPRRWRPSSPPSATPTAPTVALAEDLGVTDAVGRLRELVLVDD